MIKQYDLDLKTKRLSVWQALSATFFLLMISLTDTPSALAQSQSMDLSQGIYLAAGPTIQGISAGGIPKGNPGGIPTNSGPARSPGSSNGPYETYGLFDLKHFTTDFYDEYGHRVKRDASVRGSLRAGIKLLGGMIDASGGVGAAKLTSEARIYHNRSDAMLQIYALRSPFLDVMFYVNAMFPVRVQDLDPTEYMEGGLYDDDLKRAIDATIIVGGFTSKLNHSQPTAMGAVSGFFGFDAKVMAFSKALTGEASTETDAVSSDQTPLTDRAPRYAHQWMIGAGYSPGFFPVLQFELSASYESRYIPDYFYNRCSRSWNYDYNGDRISFTRFRLNLDVTPMTSISAESYYLRNGLFSEDRINNQSRFKNIVTATYKF